MCGMEVVRASLVQSMASSSSNPATYAMLEVVFPLHAQCPMISNVEKSMKAVFRISRMASFLYSLSCLVESLVALRGQS